MRLLKMNAELLFVPQRSSSMASSSSVTPSTPFLQEKMVMANVATGAPVVEEDFVRHGGDALSALAGHLFFPFNDAGIKRMCCSMDGCESCLTCGLCNNCQQQDETSQIMRDWTYAMCCGPCALATALKGMDRRKALLCFTCALGLRAIGGHCLGAALDSMAIQGASYVVKHECNQQAMRFGAAAAMSYTGSLCASTYTAIEINRWSMERTGTNQSNACKYCIELHACLPCFAYQSIRAVRKSPMPASSRSCQKCQCE